MDQIFILKFFETWELLAWDKRDVWNLRNCNFTVHCGSVTSAYYTGMDGMKFRFEQYV